LLTTEFVMCLRDEQLPHVIGVGQQWATTNVRQKATVICEVCASSGSLILKKTAWKKQLVGSTYDSDLQRAKLLPTNITS